MTPSGNTFNCPLCRSSDIHPFHDDKKRNYFQCTRCMIVFVPDIFWLNSKDEKAEYDLHENCTSDPGYQKFISRLSIPLLNRLSPQSVGLDFGCGPDPALPVLIEEHGHQMNRFDPFYHNTPTVLNTSYDFICATEVAEHFKDPCTEFSKLFNVLKPNGWMGIMTKLVTNKTAFKNWHYIRDNTHICFYYKITFEYIAHTFKADLEIIGNDVILMKKR